MGHKISHTLKRSKPVFIIIAVLWVASSIVFVPLFTIGVVESNDLGGFIEVLSTKIGNTGDNFSKSFSSAYIGTYFKGQAYLMIFLLFAATIGIFKSLPRHEYTDIEHGSSDWCEGGEQYKILSKKKGILLAEKHYLPIDKRGNVNVLIVGRIRFW